GYRIGRRRRDRADGTVLRAAGRRGGDGGQSEGGVEKTPARQSVTEDGLGGCHADRTPPTGIAQPIRTCRPHESETLSPRFETGRTGGIRRRDTPGRRVTRPC